jgi:hypothetical protein
MCQLIPVLVGEPVFTYMNSLILRMDHFSYCLFSAVVRSQIFYSVQNIRASLSSLHRSRSVPGQFPWALLWTEWHCDKFSPVSFHNSMLSGSLSPRHEASSGCGWRNGLQLWRVPANTLYKQLWTVDKGWSSSLGVGLGAKNSSP